MKPGVIRSSFPHLSFVFIIVPFTIVPLEGLSLWLNGFSSELLIWVLVLLLRFFALRGSWLYDG